MKIGVTINHTQNPANGAMPSYTTLRDWARAAENGGLDSIWLFDHLLFRWDEENTVGIWECWTLLSALAEATERVELGTLVLCNPFRNPALLAKMAHTLDEVSGGRLILGIGAGWHQPEFDAFGYSFERRVDRFEEALQVLSPLLRGERVDFEGDHYQARNCVMAPPGPRAEGIPLLVGAMGPRMLRLTARYANQWNTAWLGNPDDLVARIDGMRAACADVGRDPATLTVTVGVEVLCPDLGEARAFGGQPISGSATEIAQAFHGFEKAGADHVIVGFSPTGLAGLERVAEAAQIYKG